MQLSLERLVSGLLEVVRHDLLGKFMRLVNAKGFAMWLPRHDVFVSVFGSIAQQLVKLERKGELEQDCLVTMLTGLLKECKTLRTDEFLSSSPSA